MTILAQRSLVAHCQRQRSHGHTVTQFQICLIATVDTNVGVNTEQLRHTVCGSCLHCSHAVLTDLFPAAATTIPQLLPKTGRNCSNEQGGAMLCAVPAEKQCGRVHTCQATNPTGTEPSILPMGHIDIFSRSFPLCPLLLT